MMRQFRRHNGICIPPVTPCKTLPPAPLTSETSPSRKMLKNVFRLTDAFSAAGPDGMPVPHPKLLVQPRTGETAENSDFVTLHGFVRLMTESGLSADAANFHSWDTLPAFTRRSGNYRPISTGTAARRIFSFCLMKLAPPGTRY